MTFGEKLKQLRKSKFMTQQKLANELGISQSTIAAYEMDTREPVFEMVSKIANYFGIPASSLVPSSSVPDKDLVYQLAENLQSNPKLSLLFDRSRFLSESDLDTVIAVVDAIQKGRGDND